MKAYFMWVCRKIGGVFWVDTAETFTTCPCCGDSDPEEGGVFESGHCRRVFAEELLERERVGRE